MMSAENELAAIYEILGEKVGNTNLPRNLTQFKIEMAKLEKVYNFPFYPKEKSFDERREDLYKETIKYHHKIIESHIQNIKTMKLEVDGKNKHIVYLQNRIDELSLNHKKYQKKIEDLQSMIEDNDVSEFTEKIMDDAKRDIEDANDEAKVFRNVTNTQGLIIRHLILEHIRNSGDGYEFCDDGIDCSRINHLSHLIESELENLNDEDWNCDGKESYLVYEDNTIQFRHKDMDDAESSDSSSDA